MVRGARAGTTRKRTYGRGRPELARFARASARFGAVVAGQTWPATTATVEKVLLLGGETSPDVAPVGVPAAGAILTAGFLEATFPLVLCVVYEIQVARAIWDLKGVRGTNDFELVDFPGLGTSDSRVRDTYLFHRELTDLHGLLILYDANRPQGEVGADIAGSLGLHRSEVASKKMIFAGVSHFNVLFSGHAEITQLNALAATEPDPDPSSNEFAPPVPGGPRPLTEDHVLRGHPPPGQDVEADRGRPRGLPRVDLFSCPALAVVGQSGPALGLEVGRPEVVEDLRRRVEPSRALLDGRGAGRGAEWLATNKACALGRSLDDVAEDGGVGRLREVIREHVALPGWRSWPPTRGATPGSSSGRSSGWRNGSARPRPPRSPPSPGEKRSATWRRPTMR